MGRRMGNGGSATWAWPQVGGVRPRIIHKPVIASEARQSLSFINFDDGFTLIELLVVISILVLLMAILLPTLQRVRKQAQATACQANLHQWGLLYGEYAAANDSKMPLVLTKGDLRMWQAYIPGVLPTQSCDSDSPRYVYNCQDAYEDLLLCPTATKPVLQLIYGYESNSRGYTRAPWVDAAWPSHGEAPFIMSSYGQNAWMPTDIPNVVGRFWDTCLVKGASRVPVYLDSMENVVEAKEEDPPPPYEDTVVAYRWTMTCVVMDRHAGGINSLFMDWSVRKVGVKEVWTLKWRPDFNTSGPWTKRGGVAPEDWPAWMRQFKDY